MSKTVFLLRLLMLFSIGIQPIRANDDGSKAGRDRLSVLAFATFSGYPPFDGKSCSASMKIAVDAVNNRSDILPSYQVEVQFEDEGANALKATSSIMAYADSFTKARESGKDDRKFQSPVIIGPYVTPGCLPAAATVHFMSSVLLGLGCGSPNIAENRRLYKNLYLTRLPSEMMAFSRLQFIKRIGQWTKIGILTNPLNEFDYLTARYFFNVANKGGINVIWYDTAPEATDDTIRSLLSNDVRIVFFDGAGNLFLIFLCRAYLNGMAGERYVFFSTTLTYIDPATLSDPFLPWCPRAYIVEQMKSVIYIGFINTAFENNGPTSLGYDLPEFENKFDAATGKLRSPEYPIRHRCHDAVMEGLLIMDETDKLLTRRYNLTLRDMSRYPDIVMRIANESAAKIQFVGLRIGRAAYSPRLQMDDEPQIVGQWSKETGYQIVYRFDHISGTDMFNASTYTIKQFKKFRWATADDGPPRDGPLTKTISDKMPDEAFSAIAAFAAIISVAQLGILIRARFLSETQYTSSAAFRKNLLLKALIVFSCVLCNAAAVTFVLPERFSLIRNAICGSQVALTVVGLTFLHGLIVSRTISFRKVCREQKRMYSRKSLNQSRSYWSMSLRGGSMRSINNIPRKMSSHKISRRSSTLSNQLSHETMARQSSTMFTKIPEELEFIDWKSLVVFLLVNFVVLITWFAVDRYMQNTGTLSTSSNVRQYYDRERDTIFINDMENSIVCKSVKGAETWAMAFFGIHACWLLIGLFLSYPVYCAKLRSDFQEVAHVRLAVINSSTFLVATMAIANLLQDHAAIGQMVLLACALVLISAVTGTTFLSSSLKKVLHESNQVG